MSSNRKRRQNDRSRKRLLLEQLEERRVFAGQPFGAYEDDTGEFMLGRVAVTPVFLESNGQLDPSTENWTPSHIQEVLDNIREGLQWWVTTLGRLQTVHELEFVLDTTYANTPVATKYEPISRPSDDYALWVRDFLVGVGQSSAIPTGIRAFNHAQRVKLDTDWSFTIFVVPSRNDPDGQFASGGNFSRAFAFAGGLFQVVPSTRPASTFAHETGHMFWARDEYTGGGSATQRRGYYATPNSNAVDGNSVGFVQQPSIMAAGASLENAYANHVSPANTLAMLGWQDTDRDGIFDVLDVPLKLTGSGYFDTASNQYKFQGTATVQTMPNLNTEGFRNDITINRIRGIEYRVDGGAWQLYSQPNEFVVDLNLSINVPANATTIEIRAVDDQNRVESNIFTGRFARADATQVPGINGFAWIDANKNGLRDVGEFGEAGWTVNLTSATGGALNLRSTIEPDSYPEGQLASNFSSLLTLTAIGSDADGRVGAFTDTANSTGTKNFRAFSRAAQSYLSVWTASSRRLQINFASPTSVVEIDAIGAATTAYGRLEAYNAAGQLLGRYTTGPLSSGGVERMSIARGTADIAYAIASGHTVGNIRLDNLRFGPETTTTTSVRGQYAFPSLPPGSYRVQITRPDMAPISPSSGQQVVTVTANTATADVDFGFISATSQWQNPRNRFNVNDDNDVSPLDALIVIEDLSKRGSRELTGTSTTVPPYVDVSGDKIASPLDVLLIIDFLVKRNSGGGEGETEAQIQSQGFAPILTSSEMNWGEIIGEAEFSEILSTSLIAEIPPTRVESVDPIAVPLPLGSFTPDLDEVDWDEILDPLEYAGLLGYELISGEEIARIRATHKHDPH